MATPLFLAVEGIDGAGKTTVVQRIREYLSTLNIQTQRFSNPGSTEVGKELRRILLNPDCDSRFEDLSARVQWLLFVAGTADIAEKCIAPALADKMSVVQDRWTMSAAVYQLLSLGAEYWGQADLDSHLNLTFAFPQVQPHVCFFLDVDPLVAKSRLTTIDGGKDRFEAGSIEVFQKRANNYRCLIASGIVPYPVVTVPANGSLDDVWNAVRSIIDDILRK